MNAFDVAMSKLFSDTNIGIEVIHIPIDGDGSNKSKKLNAVIYQPDAFTNIVDSVIASPTLILEIVVADSQEISPGDKFMVADTLYTVQGEPKHTTDNLVWRIDLV